MAPRYMLADIPEWRHRRERTRDMKFKRLPARYGALLLPLTLSLLMSGVVSFIATLKSVGMVSNIAGLWLGAWQVSFLIAFPTLLVVLPLVRRIVALLVEPAGPPQ